MSRHDPAAVAYARPVAVRCGFTEISVARGAAGWTAVAWSPATNGPVLLSLFGELATAIDTARGYAALRADRVLCLHGIDDPVNNGGWVHILRTPAGLEVHQEGRGGSWGNLRRFDLTDEKRAVSFALDACGEYASRLGKLELATALGTGEA